MIKTEAGLQASLGALLNLKEALADLESAKAKYHPATYAIIVEPIHDEIQKILSEIDAFESRNGRGGTSRLTEGPATATAPELMNVHANP